GQVRREPLGKRWGQLDRRDSAGAADKPGQDRRVVADPGADMHGMLARPRRGAGDQRGEKRWLAVIQVPFRNDRDDDVIIQKNRISGRRRDIAAAPAYDPPRTAAEELL